MAQPVALSVLILHRNGFVVFRSPVFSQHPPNTDAESLRSISAKMDDYAARFEVLKEQSQVPDLVPSSVVNMSMKTNDPKEPSARTAVIDELRGFFQRNEQFYAEDMFGVYDSRLIELWSDIPGPQFTFCPQLTFTERVKLFCKVFQQNVERVVKPLMDNLDINEDTAAALRVAEEDRKARIAGLGTWRLRRIPYTPCIYRED